VKKKILMLLLSISSVSAFALNGKVVGRQYTEGRPFVYTCEGTTNGGTYFHCNTTSESPGTSCSCPGYPTAGTVIQLPADQVSK